MAKQPKKNTNDNLTPWEKGQSGNPNGRPPKLVSGIIKDLRENGYENVKPSQVTDIIELLLNVPKNDLIDLWDGKEVPTMVSVMAKQLSTGDRAWQAINDMLDRAHGKATQKNEVKLQGEITGFNGFTFDK